MGRRPRLANHGGALVDNHSQITAGDDQNKRLFNGYLYSSTRDTLGVNVRGLRDLYASYDVYVYFDADNEHSLSGNSVRRITDGTTSFLLDDPDGHTFAGQFVEGGNYVVFRNVTSRVFALRIDDVTSSSTNRPGAERPAGRRPPLRDRPRRDHLRRPRRQRLHRHRRRPDMVLGGKGDDTIQTFGPAVRGNVDADLVAGDNARVTLVGGVVADIHTTSPVSRGQRHHRYRQRQRRGAGRRGQRHHPHRRRRRLR